MKKSQMAMEFLMTYGWAIMVIIAAIAALVYFGVLDPMNLIPADHLNLTNISRTCLDNASQVIGTKNLTGAP